MLEAARKNDRAAVNERLIRNDMLIEGETADTATRTYLRPVARLLNGVVPTLETARDKELRMPYARSMDKIASFCSVKPDLYIKKGLGARTNSTSKLR